MNTSTREILTLQFGNYSNYVGSHWWNLQEFSFNFDPETEPSEIDHGVFYREGLNSLGNVTFTPRLLLVDLNGTLKHVPDSGGLYSDTQINLGSNIVNEQITNETVLNNLKQEIFWDPSKVEVISSTKEEKPEFQKDLESIETNVEDKKYNFKETVTSWTDILYARYHPRTIHILKDHTFSHEKDNIDTYSNGSNLWMSNIFQNDFIDNIRKYVEECNNCQGFQTLFEASNGFSGLSCKFLEYLKDEYNKTNFTIPIFTPKNILFENADEKLSNAIKLVNIASTYSNLIENSDLFVPLSTQDCCWKYPPKGRKFKYLNYDSKNIYETSAILATYLDTISLQYRLRNAAYGNSSYLLNFCSDLNNYGRKMAAAALSLPFPMPHDYDLIDTLNEIDSPIFTQLSPNCKIGTDYIMQSVCVRGIPINRLKRPFHQAQKQMQMAAYKCNSTTEMFQLYFQCSNHASMANVSAIELPIKIQKPYPEDIFHSNLSNEGMLTEYPRNSQLALKSVPCVASIQSSGDLANTLESLHREASRIKISKIHRFKETGMESDDYIEILENLQQFKNRYEDTLDL